MHATIFPFIYPFSIFFLYEQKLGKRPISPTRDTHTLHAHEHSKLHPCIFVIFNIPFFVILHLFLALIGGLQVFFSLVQVFLVFLQCLRVRAMEASPCILGNVLKNGRRGLPWGMSCPWRVLFLW